MKKQAKIPGGLVDVIRVVKPGALRMMVALSFYMNDQGEAWPGIELIRKMTGLSTRGIMRAREELGNYGLIWEKRPNRSTVYTWPVFRNGVDTGVHSQVDTGVQSGLDKIVQFNNNKIYNRSTQGKGTHFETATDRRKKLRKIMGL